MGYLFAFLFVALHFTIYLLSDIFILGSKDLWENKDVSHWRGGSSDREVVASPSFLDR
jgi:hypothetical protein